MSTERPGVLVTELLGGDGPHVRRADVFVASRCARCGNVVSRDEPVDDDDLWCRVCTDTVPSLPRLG